MTENEYLPYKAINVFINRDYLETMLESVLKGKDDLPKADQIKFVSAFKQYVTVLGFRNAARAPLSLQVNAYANAFEEKNEVIPFTLNTWVKLNGKLAEKVKSWLAEKGWENLEYERPFDESQGFGNQWPKDFTFEALTKEFKKENKGFECDSDDLILMSIWISGQLPSEQTNI